MLVLLAVALGSNALLRTNHIGGLQRVRAESIHVNSPLLRVPGAPRHCVGKVCVHSGVQVKSPEFVVSGNVSLYNSLQVQQLFPFERGLHVRGDVVADTAVLDLDTTLQGERLGNLTRGALNAVTETNRTVYRITRTMTSAFATFRRFFAHARSGFSSNVTHFRGRVGDRESSFSETARREAAGVKGNVTRLRTNVDALAKSLATFNQTRNQSVETKILSTVSPVSANRRRVDQSLALVRAGGPFPSMTLRHDLFLPQSINRYVNRGFGINITREAMHELIENVNHHISHAADYVKTEEVLINASSNFVGRRDAFSYLLSHDPIFNKLVQKDRAAERFRHTPLFSEPHREEMLRDLRDVTDTIFRTLPLDYEDPSGSERCEFHVKNSSFCKRTIETPHNISVQNNVWIAGRAPGQCTVNVTFCEKSLQRHLRDIHTGLVDIRSRAESRIHYIHFSNATNEFDDLFTRINYANRNITRLRRKLHHVEDPLPDANRTLGAIRRDAAYLRAMQPFAEVHVVDRWSPYDNPPTVPTSRSTQTLTEGIDRSATRVDSLHTLYEKLLRNFRQLTRDAARTRAAVEHWHDLHSRPDWTLFGGRAVRGVSQVKIGSKKGEMRIGDVRASDSLAVKAHLVTQTLTSTHRAHFAKATVRGATPDRLAHAVLESGEWHVDAKDRDIGAGKSAGITLKSKDLFPAACWEVSDTKSLGEGMIPVGVSLSSGVALLGVKYAKANGACSTRAVPESKPLTDCYERDSHKNVVKRKYTACDPYGGSELKCGRGELSDVKHMNAHNAACSCGSQNFHKVSAGVSLDNGCGPKAGDPRTLSPVSDPHKCPSKEPCSNHGDVDYRSGKCSCSHSFIKSGFVCPKQCANPVCYSGRRNDDNKCSCYTYASGAHCDKGDLHHTPSSGPHLATKAEWDGSEKRVEITYKTEPSFHGQCHRKPTCGAISGNRAYACKDLRFACSGDCHESHGHCCKRGLQYTSGGCCNYDETYAYTFSWTPRDRACCKNFKVHRNDKGQPVCCPLYPSIHVHRLSLMVKAHKDTAVCEYHSHMRQENIGGGCKCGCNAFAACLGGYGKMWNHVHAKCDHGWGRKTKCSGEPACESFDVDRHDEHLPKVLHRSSGAQC